MTMPHDLLHDDLPAHALGTLDPPEAARLERHLAECAACRLLLREYEEVMSLLPLGLPLTEPPRAARRELLRRLRKDDASAMRRVADGWRHPVRPGSLAAAAALVAVVAVVVLVAVAGTMYWSRSEGDDSEDTATIVEELRQSPNTRIVSMLGSDAAPKAVAQLLFQPGETRAALVISGLPPLPSDRAYQLWFVAPNETRFNGGVFTVDSDGQAMVVIDAPVDYAPGWRCGVTEEPSGGSGQPTGQNVLRGAYTDRDW